MKKEATRKRNNNRHQSEDDIEHLLRSAAINDIWDVLFGPAKKKRTV